ncbi:hypothetical protein CLOSCI_00679 [[Clostridium] scindens ATCC 35704]|nr:chorismate mutase [[Clostridium] scindens]EDS08367.1 hypothetical protein CLOSCI_00679 [[Clostridium] scindens ATCC 35704]
MPTLEELRIRLDDVDEQMVRLFEERMSICEEVGEYKVKMEGKFWTARESGTSFRRWPVKYPRTLIRKRYRNSMTN